MKNKKKNSRTSSLLVASLLSSTVIGSIPVNASGDILDKESGNTYHLENFYNNILEATSLEELWKTFSTHNNELEEAFTEKLHNDLVTVTISVSFFEQKKDHFETSIKLYDLVLESTLLTDKEKELIKDYKESAINSDIIADLDELFSSSELYSDIEELYSFEEFDFEDLNSESYLLDIYLINNWSTELEYLNNFNQDNGKTTSDKNDNDSADVSKDESEDSQNENQNIYELDEADDETIESSSNNSDSDNTTEENLLIEENQKQNEVDFEDENVKKEVHTYEISSLDLIDDLYNRAINGNGASARWNAAVEGVRNYPNDVRFIEALQLASHNMLRLGTQAHESGNYVDALHYYNLLQSQTELEESVISNITRYQQQAETSSKLETQEDLLQRALSGSGASNRWHAALEGLEFYPEDKRFVNALQAASHNILRLGLQAHERGHYSDALVYYNRLASQDLLEENISKRVTRYKQQAETSSKLETQEDLLQRALSGSGASNRWNAALEGLEFYPEDKRFVNALQAASHNILRLGLQAHERGHYSDALVYYNRLASQDLLEENISKRVTRYKQQAETSSKLETQEDLLQRALSGSGASNRWNAALEGLESYPEDKRFVNALQAASQNILRLGLQAHERGHYSDALVYYNRLASQNLLENSVSRQVARYKQQAESSTPLETKDDLYNRAVGAKGASARWHASIEGLQFYPEDSRFLEALRDSSHRILRLGMDAHRQSHFDDAVDYYQRLLNENRVPNDILNLSSKLNELAAKGKRIMTVGDYINAINSSSYASEIWHLVTEAIFLYPNDSRIQRVLDDAANRQLILGRNYYRSGNLSGSKIYFERVLSEPMVSQGLKTLASSYSRLTQANYKPTIYIDAGHGGYDPGATFGGVQEKVLNLNTSLYLKKELEKRGYNVLMSRTTDKYMDLTARPLEANEINADLFVSIHYNSMGGSGTAKGIETFIYHRVASGYGQEVNRSNFNTHQSRINESLLLADAVHNNLIRETGMRNRRVKGQNFNVLRNTEIPAMLTELGFLDNAVERAHVNRASFQRAAARAMANGVDVYFGN